MYCRWLISAQYFRFKTLVSLDDNERCMYDVRWHVLNHRIHEKTKWVRVLQRISKFNKVGNTLCYIRCLMRFELSHITRTRTKHKSFTHRFFLDKFKIREHSLSSRFQTRRFKTNILHVTVSYIAGSLSTAIISYKGTTLL